VKRKMMRIQAAILSRFTSTILSVLFFAMQHGKTETSYAIYAIVIIALCSLFLLDLSFRKKNMLKKLTRSQVATMSRSVNKNFGIC
jgi:O-antigen/teichoic acid export membrane protein